MKKTTKTIIIIYLAILLFKLLIASTITSPSIFADEYIYSKTAKSFYDNFEFKVQNIPTNTYPPLYPILLSISFIFSDNMILVYLLMKIINCLISGLIIIPGYLLSKEFLNKKLSIISTILIGIHPAIFNFSNYIMAENLYYPLFLTSIYFLYKSIKENSYKTSLFLGIITGLTILTKFAGIILIPIIGLTSLYLIIYKKQLRQIETKAISLIIAFLTLIPWFIRNKLVLGNFIGHYGEESLNFITVNFIKSIIIFSDWIIINLFSLLLSSGIILFLFNFTKIKTKIKDEFFIITLISIITVVLISSNHNINILIKQTTLIPWLSGRPIGRYLEVVIPLIIINGLRSIDFKIFSKKIKTLILVITIIGSQITFFQLFPVNNMGLTWIGISKYLLEFLTLKKASFEPIFNITSFSLLVLLLISIMMLTFKLIKNLTSNQILATILIFFVISSLITSSAIIYNNKINWENNPQIQTGKWIENNLKEYKVINLDQESCGKNLKVNLCTTSKMPQVIGFFVNKKIKFSNEPKQIFITNKELNYKKLYEKDKIYIYNIEN